MVNTIDDVAVAGMSLRISITLDGPSAMKRVRVEVRDGRSSYDVRGWGGRIPGLAGPYFLQDHEAPLNTPLTIVLWVGDDQAVVWQGGPVTLRSATPLISDPLRGVHVPVTIQSWPEEAFERDGKIVTVADSRYPVVIEGFERAPSSTITLIHTEGGADALEELLSDQSILRVRPSCPSFPARWVSARSRRRTRFSKRVDSAVVDVIELLHMAMPFPTLETIWDSLEALHVAVPGTLADIHARWPHMLGDIAREKL